MFALFAVYSVNAHTQLIVPVLSGLGLSSLALGGAKFIGLAGLTSGIASSIGTLGLSRAIAKHGGLGFLSRADNDVVFYDGVDPSQEALNEGLGVINLAGNAGYDNRRFVQSPYQQ